MRAVSWTTSGVADGLAGFAFGFSSSSFFSACALPAAKSARSLSTPQFLSICASLGGCDGFDQFGRLRRRQLDQPRRMPVLRRPPAVARVGAQENAGHR